ncbi:MAG TPA: type II secretion system protein [Terriglobales bacterium]|nr:type II secretion system protein [Terriglobales bacterium]
MKRRSQNDPSGFTLIEMMVAITVIIILLAIAIPIFSRSIRQAMENNFKQNLDTLNLAVYQYTLDKQKAPKSVNDLKSAGYLTEVPKDITGSADWETEEDEKTIMSLQQTEGGIFAIKSASNRVGSNGKPYSEW